MSAIEYELIDAFSNQATKSQGIRPAPLTVLGPFPFTFATPGLTTGVPLVTLPVGAVIYDIGISVSAVFNGTTPLADVGTFVGGNVGLTVELAEGPVDLTAADTAITDNAGLSQGGAQSWIAAGTVNKGIDNTAVEPAWPLLVTAVSQLLLVVSQNGQKGGTATGATTGVGAVYVLAATPTVS